MKNLIFLVVLFLCSQSYAAQVNSVSSETISGESFGAGSVVIISDTFEGGTVDSDISEIWTKGKAGTYYPKYTNTVAVSGDIAISCDMSTDISQYSSYFMKTGSWEELFVSFFNRNDFFPIDGYLGQPSRNYKVIRIEGDNGTKEGDQQEGVPLIAYEKRQPTDGSCEVAVRAQYLPISQSDTFYPGNPGWANAEWHNVEMYMNVDNNTQENRTFKIWVDGVDKSPSVETLSDTWIPYMGNDSSKFNEIKIGFYNARDGDSAVIAYFDDVFIATNQARVVVCDSQVYASRTALKTFIQPHASWTDTSISFTSNQGSFTNNETVYLFVVDADGNVSNGVEGYFIDGTFYSGCSSCSATVTGTLNVTGTLEIL